MPSALTVFRLMAGPMRSGLMSQLGERFDFLVFWEGRAMSYHSKHVDAFLSDIRSSPKFAAAASADSQWSDHLEAMERAIAALYRDPEMIDAFDKLQAVIDSRGLSMKEKLIEIGKILTQVRDSGRSVN